MNQTLPSDKKPYVGFFPLSFNLAETGRAIMIAKRYKKLGGKVIFFTHGGEYEYLIKNQGFDFVRVNPLFTKDIVARIRRINKENMRKDPYSESFLRECVKS